jgi:hypothetical protein
MPPQRGVHQIWNPKTESAYDFYWDKDEEPDYKAVARKIFGEPESEDKPKWGDYSAMALRGAASFAPPGFIGAGVAGAADAVGQGLEMMGGSREKFNTLQLGAESALGICWIPKACKDRI